MRFKGLDLNLLVAFDALLHERSVSRAALRVNLSQPAMSAALSRIREFFGDPILEADGRRMIATAYALRLQPLVEHMLSSVEDMISESRLFDPVTSTRHFAIGSSDYIVVVLLRDMLAELAVTAPGLTFSIAPPSDNLVPMLDRGEIDLTITPEENLTADHPAELLFEEAHVVVGCRNNSWLAATLTKEQFCGAGHVAMDVGTGRPNAFAEKYFARSGIERRIEVLVESFTLIPELVVGTKRLGVMHERLAIAMARRLPIAIVPMPFAFPLLREHIRLGRSRVKDEGVKWLVGELHRHAEERRRSLAANRKSSFLATAISPHENRLD